MENIYEKCVVKHKDIKDNLITLASVLGVVIISAVAILIEPIRQFAIIAVVFLVYIAYRIITDRNIEYEYILAANSFSLDRIFNKRRRKRMINCDLTDFDLIAPVASAYYEEHRDNSARTITAVSGENKETEYFGLVEYDGKRTLIIFETDERALKHIRKYIDRALKS